MYVVDNKGTVEMGPKETSGDTVTVVTVGKSMIGDVIDNAETSTTALRLAAHNNKRRRR
jgi:hypothetical protein